MKNIQWPPHNRSGFAPGFTLIELIVVLAIMSTVLGLVIIDFGSRRSERDVKAAQNELVTNIRKVQSYALFSRDVNNVKSAQYYILKFATSTPDRYFIQAVTDSNSTPLLNSLETVLLPRNVQIYSATITRPVPPYSSASENAPCALLAFSAPYSKAYVNRGCTQTQPSFQGNDDYLKILEHTSNIDNSTVSMDTDLLITLRLKGSTLTKQVLVKGVTGLICPTNNGTVCSF